MYTVCMDLYTVPAKCHVCHKDYKARYNMVGRAKVCTPTEHKCQVKVEERLDGRRRIIQCTEQCCRSKYKKAAATMADAAIDTRKLLDDAELDEVVKRIDKLDDPERICLLFIIETGCRLGEALLVRTDYIEWKLGSMSVVRMPTLKKSGHPLLPVHLDNRRPFASEFKGWVSNKKVGEPLFPCAKRTLQRKLERILDEVKPERSSLVHLLRHTRASRLVRSGMPMDQVRKELRWASIELLKVYAHRTEEEVADAFSRV